MARIDQELDSSYRSAAAELADELARVAKDFATNGGGDAVHQFMQLTVELARLVAAQQSNADAAF